MQNKPHIIFVRRINRDHFHSVIQFTLSLDRTEICKALFEDHVYIFNTEQDHGISYNF